MSRPRNRYFGPLERDELLGALKSCRDACVRASMRAPINGDIYKSVEQLMNAIDDVAGVLTGDPTHFHLKSAPSRQEPKA